MTSCGSITVIMAIRSDVALGTVENVSIKGGFYVQKDIWNRGCLEGVRWVESSIFTRTMFVVIYNFTCKSGDDAISVGDSRMSPPRLSKPMSFSITTHILPRHTHDAFPPMTKTPKS